MEGWSVGILRGVVFLPSSVHHRVGLSAVVRSEGYAPLGSVWTKAEGRFVFRVAVLPLTDAWKTWQHSPLE
jgi:hypothetical protein